MKGIGSRNKYWVGSIDQNGLHVAFRDMLGAPFAILHTDIDHSDYMLFIGSNPKISGMNWLGHLPDGWKRALQAQKRGAKITIVDPRKTESAEKADLHISPMPGTDWALVLGLIKVIVEEGLDRSRYADRLTGLAEIKALASSVELAEIAVFCDIDEGQIQQVAREFAAARRGFAVARTGVAQTLGGSVGLWLLSFFPWEQEQKAKQIGKKNWGDFKDFSDRVSRLKALGFHEGGKSSSTWVSPD